MRIYDSTGVLVTTINLPAAGNGFITSYASAINGPIIGGAIPTGYNPLVFTPTKNGNYWIELYRSSNGGLSEIASNETMMSPLFDMTVAQSNNTQFKGRIHSNKWAYTVYDPTTYNQPAILLSQAQFFAYTTDSVVNKIDFQSGFRPLAFIMAQ